MGGKVSSAKEAELVERTKLPIGQVRRLIQRYSSLCEECGGEISRLYFQNIPEFSAIPMPLVEGLLHVLMSSESSTIGEEDFIKVFTMLHQDTSVDEKISCLMKVFDRDADGLVGQAELHHVSCVVRL